MSGVGVQAVDQTVKVSKMTKAGVNVDPEPTYQSCRPRHQASVNSVSNDTQLFTESITRGEATPGDP